MAERYIKDGQVAVLYSPRFGAGWFTWSSKDDESMIFDPELVEAVLAEDYKKAIEIAERKWPEEYNGGVDDLRVYWMTPGTAFVITEYDGNESIHTYDDRCLVA